MSDETKSTQFSLDPNLASWTNHTREHTLMSEEHMRQHKLESDAQNDLSKAHWEFHAREHESGQRAVDKVEKGVEARFASVNEFREQLREQARTFVNRGEYAGLETRLSSMETYRAQNEGRDRGSAPYTNIIFSVVSAVLSALAVGAVVIATRAP